MRSVEMLQAVFAGDKDLVVGSALLFEPLLDKVFRDLDADASFASGGGLIVEVRGEGLVQLDLVDLEMRLSGLQRKAST